MNKENIVIVDEKDNIIGNAPYDSQKTGNIYRVTALWITNSRGEILLAKRHRNREHDPSKWGPAVSGTVEEGESYEQNIVKEAEEEIGLENISPKLGPKIKIEDKYNFFAQWFTSEIDRKIDEFKIQEDEVEELRWILKNELIQELKVNPENFTPGMQKCAKLFL
jgi:isopentenyldiphosphate isomerase